VLVPDRAQNAAVGGVSGLAATARRQLQLLEKDAAELLWRAEREGLAGQLLGTCFQLREPLRQPRQTAQRIPPGLSPRLPE